MRAFRPLLISLTLLWMGLIFMLSAQPADESSQLSGGLISAVLEVMVSQIEVITPERQATLIEALHTPVRKTAHACIYAVLGLLTSASVWSFMSSRRALLPSFLICALYAITDEWHQYYVPGRSMELRDMLIDMAGALLGIALLYFIKCRQSLHYPLE